jgi:hypothetical protein
MSGHLSSMETNSESQRVCRQCCDGAAGSQMNIRTRWSMALRSCFGRLFASLSTWLACQRRAQRPRLITPRLPPRPSRRNKGIGPEGATSLAGPLATLTKFQWLELRYCPLAACEGWRLEDGRPDGGEMRMGLVPGREGILSASPRPSLRSAARRAPPRPRPHPPVPVRYDSRRPSPQ